MNPRNKPKEIPSKLLEDYVHLYNINHTLQKPNNELELEAKFGTNTKIHKKPISKMDYDNVARKFKSMGFTSDNETGMYRLSIQGYSLEKNTGEFRWSNVRTEIHSANAIQLYCRTNSINKVFEQYKNQIVFTRKTLYNNTTNGELVKYFPIDFDDFNFRVSLNNEETNPSIKHHIIENWTSTSKRFRFINRVTFKHPDYPINVDLSIVKQTSGDSAGYSTIDESNIFNKPEKYEIELEINNDNNTGFSTKKLLSLFKKTIKFVLSGLQDTNYPISNIEQNEIINSYKLLYKTNEPSNDKQYPIFIGPSSRTLKMENISEISDEFNIPNIRKDFTVTEKADGSRSLLYINLSGKIYLINTNLNIGFTGTQTKNNKLFNTIIDGELILHDKFGKYINLFMAFDIYYINGINIRNKPFMKVEKITEYRYGILTTTINTLDAVSVITSSDGNNIAPLKIRKKNFYSGNIFNNVNDLLLKTKNELFEYEVDGLIFTHAYYGVNSDKIGMSGPLTNSAWNYSFKWKPPKYNTIDFLVTTVKNNSGNDLITPMFEQGVNTTNAEQINEYKTIQLNCSFSQKRDGYINPCQNLIDYDFPEIDNTVESIKSDIVPARFYPTKPYDSDAGICKIKLTNDNNITQKQMVSIEGDMFDNDMIVEFSYNREKPKGWRWEPLRVRYDKTTAYKQNKKQYGNAYYVANDNWQSIHNPVTAELLSSGENIPEISIDNDIYYNGSNTDNAAFKTGPMKNFHNLFVKKNLILSVANKGDTLIDYACGKAGDLPKWNSAKLSFIFGVDLSKDNLENKLDGACARYLNVRKTNKHIPDALFVNGDCAYNIKNGDALLNEKSKQIVNAIFGHGTNNETILGKGVAKQYGKINEGFNISSCQFALHYFLKDANSMRGFIKNISECTQLNGYFIGTAYDGLSIFNMLKNKKIDESIQIMDGNVKLWEIIKKYNSVVFDNNSGSIGLQIDVYQESINQYISEYLINFDYFNRIMLNYGFKLINKEEANNIGFPNGSGMFNELYNLLIAEVKNNKYHNYGSANKMTSYEKKISFLNRYFIYKKFENVDADNIELDLSDYSNSEIINNIKETNDVIKIVKKTQDNSHTGIKKINKKIVIIGESDNSIDDDVDDVIIDKNDDVIIDKNDDVIIDKNDDVIIDKDDAIDNVIIDKDNDVDDVNIIIDDINDIIDINIKKVVKEKKEKVVKEKKEKVVKEKKEKVVKEKKEKVVKEKVVKEKVVKEKVVKEKVVKEKKEKVVKEKVVKPKKLIIADDSDDDK